MGILDHVKKWFGEGKKYVPESPNGEFEKNRYEGYFERKREERLEKTKDVDRLAWELDAARDPHLLERMVEGDEVNQERVPISENTRKVQEEDIPRQQLSRTHDRRSVMRLSAEVRDTVQALADQLEPLISSQRYGFGIRRSFGEWWSETDGGVLAQLTTRLLIGVGIAERAASSGAPASHLLIPAAFLFGSSIASEGFLKTVDYFFRGERSLRLELERKRSRERVKRQKQRRRLGSEYRANKGGEQQEPLARRLSAHVREIYLLEKEILEKNEAYQKLLSEHASARGWNKVMLTFVISELIARVSQGVAADVRSVASRITNENEGLYGFADHLAYLSQYLHERLGKGSEQELSVTFMGACGALVAYGAGVLAELRRGLPGSERQKRIEFLLSQTRGVVGDIGEQAGALTTLTFHGESGVGYPPKQEKPVWHVSDDEVRHIEQMDANELRADILHRIGIVDQVALGQKLFERLFLERISEIENPSVRSQVEDRLVALWSVAVSGRERSKKQQMFERIFSLLHGEEEREQSGFA